MTEALALQHQTLRLYGELVVRAPAWAGKLILAAGAGCSGTGLAAAGSIAGGTTLAVDPDTAAVRSTLRQGGVDFVVNTLDEAIRVLKNEIRQGRPLGVALTADPSVVLAEAQARGLLPDLIVTFGDHAGLQAELQPLAGGGDAVVALGGSQATPALESWLGERGWSELTLPAASGGGLRELDARLVAVLPAGDPRVGWLRGITRYQRSAAREGRVLWLSGAEHASLSTAEGCGAF